MFGGSGVQVAQEACLEEDLLEGDKDAAGLRSNTASDLLNPKTTRASARMKRSKRGARSRKVERANCRRRLSWEARGRSSAGTKPTSKVVTTTQRKPRATKMVGRGCAEGRRQGGEAGDGVITGPAQK